MVSTLLQPKREILSDSLLQRCAERASTYDRESRFCQEDFEDLKAASYLQLTIPPELGGQGLSLAEMSQVTRQLAYVAPATALCLNMHHYWVGVAADLYRAGDRSVLWILERVAEMVLKLESIIPQLDRVAADWATGVNHGGTWPAKLVAVKYNVVEGAWKIVDRAMDLSGGFGMFKKCELERLFRDARAGRFHPANAALTHEIVAKISLGLDLDAQPRWG